jgi:ectoine utilization protein EutC
MLILNESEIRACVALDLAALEAVEEGFACLARGEVIVPAPMNIDVPERQTEIHVKTAYARGLPGFAVKIASGFGINAARGLPTSSGLMVLLSAETGFPLALLLDNGYLTDVRTAVAGAIAAKHLARTEVPVIGIVGTGDQARYQVRALRLVRDVRRVVVYGRRREAAEAYAQEMSEELQVPVDVAVAVADLVAASDLVITTTGSRAALIEVGDVRAALHITAMGSDGPGKQELDPRILGRADKVVCDLRSQCARLGELQHALRAGILGDAAPVLELGDLVAGLKPGRTSDSELTVCDLTGLGIQDTSIALFAYERAKAAGLGREQ